MLIVPISQSGPISVTQPPFAVKSNGDPDTHFEGPDAAGLDFGVPFGTQVVSMADARLVTAYFGATTGTGDAGIRGFGNVITLEHTIVVNGVSETFYATYGHLSKESVKSLLVSVGVNVNSVSVYWEDLDDQGQNYWITSGQTIAISANTGVLIGPNVHVHFGRQLDIRAGETIADGEKTVPNINLLNLLTFFGKQFSVSGANLPDVAVDDLTYGDLVYSNVILGGDIVGNDGNDRFLLSENDDVVRSGNGVDTAIFSGTYSDYNILRYGENLLISGPDGIDALKSVEFLEFSNSIVDVSLIEDGFLTLSGAQTNSIYDSGPGRQNITPDPVENTFWFNLWDLGLSVPQTLGKTVVEILSLVFSPTVAFAANGETVTEFTSPALTDDLRLASTYTQIGVNGYGSTDINYLLNNTLPPETDDHGDTLASATTFGTGTVGSYEYIAGEIETVGDQDWFKVSLIAGQEYAFFMSAQTDNNLNPLDPFLGLRDSAGATVATNNNVAPGILSSFISYTATYSGVFYLSAEGSASTTGGYGLNATNITTSNDADNLTPTAQPDDPASPSNWDWQGTSGDDNPSSLTLGGNSGNDRFRAHDGDDRIYAGSGNDVVWGDDDDDRLYGEAGRDVLKGGRGEDRLYGGEGNDELYGERGDDSLKGNNGNDYLHGGDGNDNLDGHDGDDYLKGGSGNDDLDGGAGNDELYGDEGVDELNGRDGNDILFGGTGNDDLDGDGGNDRLDGEEGDDFLDGDDGDDVLFGGEDNDILRGGPGNDYLNGWTGIDTADFSDGNDGVVIPPFLTGSACRITQLVSVS